MKSSEARIFLKRWEIHCFLRELLNFYGRRDKFLCFLNAELQEAHLTPSSLVYLVMCWLLSFPFMEWFSSLAHKSAGLSMQGSRPGILAPAPAPFPGAVALRALWFTGKCSLFLRTIASPSSAKFSDKLPSKLQRAAGSRSPPDSGIPWHQEWHLQKCLPRTRKRAQGTWHRRDHSYCLSKKM